MARVFLFFTVVLFGIIAFVAWMKTGSNKETVIQYTDHPKEIVLQQSVAKPNSASDIAETPSEISAKPPLSLTPEPPKVNRIEALFTKGSAKLPIVETLVYRSQVEWLKGRPAWISDYASHYKTSRHFIARSLNGKPDYKKQNIAIGDRFNVLRNDIDLSFYLLIDTTRLRLWFYSYTKDNDERILLKTYDVGLGRLDPDQLTGMLTPRGTYLLGDKVGIYEPGKYSWVNGEKTEMVRIFGTRWIPFEKEVEGCTAPSKGYGIHGLPWRENRDGELVEARDLIKKYDSDGCVRLCQEDVEEIFSIVITKPAYVVIVDDFYKAKLPGEEKDIRF